MQEDELIDLATAAELVGVKVNPSTLRRAAQSGRLKARKVGRDWLTTVRNMREWNNNEQHHKTGPKPPKTGG